MMISPENYAEDRQNQPFEKLVAERDALIKEIRLFEKHRDEMLRDICIDPSPETVYLMNLEYLAKLCDLLSLKYRENFFYDRS